MFARKLFRISLLFLFVIANGQLKITLPVNTKKADLEFIIRQEKNFGNNLPALESYLAPLKNSHEEVHRCIYHVLYANGYEQFTDRISPEADQHFQKAIACKNNKAVQAWAKLSYAKYLYKYRDYQRNVPQLTDAMYLLETMKDEEIIFPGESFQFIGYVMQTLQELKESNYFLNRSNQFLNENSTAYAANLDNMGNNYLLLQDYNNAKLHFERAIKTALKIKDYERYAKASGNLGDLYFRQKNYPAAIELLKRDIEFTKNYGGQQNLMYANTQLSKIYLAADQEDEAAKTIEEALKIATSKEYFKSTEYEILQMKLKLARKKNNTTEELDVYQRIKDLEADLATMDSEENTYKANWEVQKSNYKRQLALTKQQISKETLQKNTLMVITVLAIGAGIMLYLFYRRKVRSLQNAYEERVEFFENEKSRYENELRSGEQGITDQISFIKEKNRQIQQLNAEIERLSKTKSYRLEQSQGKLHKLLESHLMTDENWNNFKEEFYIAYPHIEHELNENYTDISESYLRTIFLQKLGFSNTEISGLLGITVDAVKKSRQRLRRKLDHRYDEFQELMNSDKVS